MAVDREIKMTNKSDHCVQSNLNSMRLTENEAMVLLELCLYSKVDDDPIRASLLSKVSSVCKKFIRPESEHDLDYEMNSSLNRRVSR